MLNIQAIHDAIDEFVLKGGAEEYDVRIPDNTKKKREYLGLSALGEECRRKTWYEFRKVAKKSFPSRMLRLFRRGDVEEYRFLYLLRGIGFTIWEKDENGKQFKIIDFEGHLSGSMDGVAHAPDKFWVNALKKFAFLLEFKSYNDKRFNLLLKEGVKKADIKYYVQCIGYMGYNKLQGCLFCAVNKNDDELYFEWVPFDKFAFKRIVNSGEDILKSDEPLERVEGASPSWWKCKNSKFKCDFYDICWKGAPAIKSCRSCKFAVPAENATWECTKGKEFGTVCKLYKDVTK